MSKLDKYYGQTGGNAAILENEEYVKTNSGKVLKIKNAPKHEDKVLKIGGRNKKVPFGKGGVVVPNVKSALSATHENRNSKSKLYTYKDEEIKIMPAEVKAISTALALPVKLQKKAISPAKLLDLLVEKRDNTVKKYRDPIDSSRRSSERFSAITSNRAVLASLPTTEDLYDFVFDLQESKKSGGFGQTLAQTGMEAPQQEMSQEEQLMQLFQAFADVMQDDEFNTAEEVLMMFQELSPEEQERFIQQAIQIVQGAQQPAEEEYDEDEEYEVVDEEEYEDEDDEEEPMMQGGGNVLYVESKNDPRYKSYQDSLGLYNSNKFARKLNSKFEFLKEGKFVPYNNLKKELIKKYGTENPNLFQQPNGTIQYGKFDYIKGKDFEAGQWENADNYSDFKKKKHKNLPIGFVEELQPDYYPNQPNYNAIYKKPQQPVQVVERLSLPPIERLDFKPFQEYQSRFNPLEIESETEYIPGAYQGYERVIGSEYGKNADGQYNEFRHKYAPGKTIFKSNIKQTGGLPYGQVATLQDYGFKSPQTDRYIPKKKIVTKAELAASKKAIAEENKKIVADRYANVAKSMEARNTGFFPTSPTNFAERTQAIGDKFRVFPNDPNSFFDDWLNPGVIIGDMASGIGAIPKDVQEGNYGKAAFSLGLPIVTGALAGIGAKTTGQFVNNLANPLAGTGDLVNNLGNKYLPNAYKYNPFAKKAESFNNPNSFYRQVDDETFKEGLESGLIKGKQNVDKTRGENIINLNKSFGDDAYYKKSSLYSPQRADYIYEVQKGEEAFIPKVNYKTKGYTTENTPIRVSREPIPINEATVYKKDWLKGYKEVEVPKAAQNFKSEIDWAKWNKEIPENKALMQEYNAIEQQAKATGTWMKNSDGSAFQGTPEQFVQQNSENFKKAFPKGSDISYRGDLSKISELKSQQELGKEAIKRKYNLTDEDTEALEKLWSRAKDRLNSGKYTTNDYEAALKYAKGDKDKVLSLYTDIRNPKFTDTGESFRVLEKDRQKLLSEGYDALITKPSSFYPEGENVLLKTNQIKSAVGNDGMFDMTNPNIYKALFPGLVAGSAVMNNKQTGGIPERYINKGFTKVGVKKQAPEGSSKKWQVLAKKGDDYKIVSGGYRGMEDYTQHGDKDRQKNFWNRMGGKDSAKANDKFSPLFWHKKFGTWQTGGYIVKEGDNLSSIAKNNNILLKDLISSNNIVDANKLAVGQKIIIPAKKTINPTYNSKQEYNISKGDTLYDISKKFNIGVSELKKHNDLKSDTILAGSKLYIPFGVNEQVRGQNKKAVTTFKDNSERDSNKVIQDFYKNKNEEYVVIDKKTGTLNNYKGNKLLSSINVGHGKTGEDIITGLGGVKNYSTGAGIFTIASNDEDVFVRKDKNNNKLYGDNIRGYKNEAGQVQGSFLHQVPNNNTEREKKLDDNDPSNNNFSQGCINCKKKDFTSVVSKLKPGTKLYILPQEKDNYFEVKNNKINFTTNKNKDIRGYNYTYDDKGNYLSPKVRDATYAPFDIPNKKSAIFDNRNTRLQQEILNKNKKQLMKDLNLDSDTYDVLAKQLIGHIKQETGSSYKADVGERFINNILDITDVTVPSVTYPFTDKKVFGKHSGKTYTSENSSRGDLQIRYNQIPKEILKKYNVNSPDDLDDIEKAIPIGMFLKKDGLAQVIAKRNKLNNLTKSNIYDFVPYQYNQAKLLQEKDTNPKKNKYVQNVLTYADTKQNNIWQTGPQKTKLTNYPYMKGSRPALSTSNGKSIEVLDGRTISMDNIYDADSVIVKGNEGKTFYKSKLKKYIK